MGGGGINYAPHSKDNGKGEGGGGGGETGVGEGSRGGGQVRRQVDGRQEEDRWKGRF